MKISADEVKHLSKLSWIEVSPSDVEQYAKELSSILEYVEKLSQLDTSKVDPTYHVMPHEVTLRADEVKPSFKREDFLAVVPSHEEGSIKVPKIIDAS